MKAARPEPLNALEVQAMTAGRSDRSRNFQPNSDTMNAQQLDTKLRDIHTLLTCAMWARPNRTVDSETEGCLEDAEKKLNDLENELAVSPLSQASIQGAGDAEEKRISASLQRQFDGREPTCDRRLYVAFGFGYYQRIASALIEVEGSPTRGMVLIRGAGVLHGSSEHDVDVWVMQRGQKMKHLQVGCKEAGALLSFAQSKLPARLRR